MWGYSEGRRVHGAGVPVGPSTHRCGQPQHSPAWIRVRPRSSFDEDLGLLWWRVACFRIAGECPSGLPLVTATHADRRAHESGPSIGIKPLAVTRTAGGSVRRVDGALVSWRSESIRRFRSRLRLRSSLTGRTVIVTFSCIDRYWSVWHDEHACGGQGTAGMFGCRVCRSRRRADALETLISVWNVDHDGATREAARPLV